MSGDDFQKDLDDYKRSREEDDDDDDDKDFKRKRSDEVEEQQPEIKEITETKPLAIQQQRDYRVADRNISCRTYVPRVVPRVAPRPISVSGYNNARGCKYGLSCRSRETCTFIHSNYADDKTSSWCGCFDLMCEFPHPNRNREPSKLKNKPPPRTTSSTTSTDLPPRYVCKMCNVPGHLIARCPRSTCFKCGGRGHMASVCSSR